MNFWPANIAFLRYSFVGGKKITFWEHQDRMIAQLIYRIIQPTFKHFIAKYCLHLKGPSAVKDATQMITGALNRGKADLLKQFK